MIADVYWLTQPSPTGYLHNTKADLMRPEFAYEDDKATIDAPEFIPGGSLTRWAGVSGQQYISASGMLREFLD